MTPVGCCITIGPTLVCRRRLNRRSLSVSGMKFAVSYVRSSLFPWLVVSPQVTCSRGVKIKADCKIADCEQRDWDAVVCSGGMPGAVHLKESGTLEAILKKQVLCAPRGFDRQDVLFVASTPVYAPVTCLPSRPEGVHPFVVVMVDVLFVV